jgi:hypothetical protein
MEKYEPFLHLAHIAVAGNSINGAHWTYSEDITAFTKMPHYTKRAVFQLNAKNL